MLITLFRDRFALEKQQKEVSRDDLVELVKKTRAPSKHDLPLLKLATYGDNKTADGAYRHDANVLQIYGIEADYDGEKISFAEAEAALRTADLDCILYTTASHTPEAPRWRVLFPFLGVMLPAGRGKMADRANAVLSGALARETWTLSQAFYFGKADDAPEFLVADLRGRYQIDAAVALQEIPYKRPARERHTAAHASPGSFESLPASLKRAIKSGDPKPFGHGDDRSRLVFDVACKLARLGWEDQQIADLLVDRDYGISAHVREQGRPQAYALRQAQDAREAVDTGWVYSARGTILPNHQDNIKKALNNIGATFSYNVFTSKGYVTWPAGEPSRRLDDHEVNELRLAIDREFLFLPAKDFFFDMMDHLTHLNPFHPVKDYLARVEPLWDGTPRVGNVDGTSTAAPSWLTLYGGAEDTPFHRAAGRLMLLAAVRRIRDPGCKFDEIMVLVDPNQGTEKSSALAALAVEDDWFTDSLQLDAEDRKIVEHLAGKWIIEYAELKGMRARDVESLKAFLSKKYDVARMAYDRMVTEAPRQAVFFATTNSTAFLKDQQNRRYWPIRVGAFNIPAMRRDIDQLWAEAAQAESAGESIRLDRSLWTAAAEVQQSYRQAEPWVDIVRSVIPDDMNGKITVHNTWAIIGKPGYQRISGDSERLLEAMRELNFQHKNARFGDRVHAAFVRNPTNERNPREIITMFDPIDQRMIAAYADIPHGDAPF